MKSVSFCEENGQKKRYFHEWNTKDWREWSRTEAAKKNRVMKIECYFEVFARHRSEKRKSKSKIEYMTKSTYHIFYAAMLRVVRAWVWAADSNWPAIFYWNGYEWKDVKLIYSISLLRFFFFFFVIFSLSLVVLRPRLFFSEFSVCYLVIGARAQEHAFTFSVCVAAFFPLLLVFFLFSYIRLLLKSQK